jgi:hypothetical protein
MSYPSNMDKPTPSQFRRLNTSLAPMAEKLQRLRNRLAARGYQTSDEYMAQVDSALHAMRSLIAATEMLSLGQQKGWQGVPGSRQRGLHWGEGL